VRGHDNELQGDQAGEERLSLRHRVGSLAQNGKGAACRGGPLQGQTNRSEDRPPQGKKDGARLGRRALQRQEEAAHLGPSTSPGVKGLAL
jgi:hypothetical protein